MKDQTQLRPVAIKCSTFNVPNRRRKIRRLEYRTVYLSLFHRAFQFTICNGPTNALVCNKTIIQMLQ
jgi:hypothetical protein